MKKLKLSTKTKIIKNDKINTIDFVLIFPSKYVRQDAFNLEIARLFFHTSSKKFPTKKEIQTETESKLIINRSSSYTIEDGNLYIRFDLTVPKEGLISDYSLDEAFKLFVDTIYNPLVENGKFLEKKFEYEKTYLMNRELDGNRDIYRKAHDKFMKFIDPEEKIYLSHESRLDYYKKTNAYDAYEAYKKYVIDNKFISYVYGDIEEERVKELFSKYLPIKDEFLEVELEIEKYLTKDKYTCLEENTKFNQSALYLAYMVDDFKDEDAEYLSLIGNILGQKENDLIFKTLRIDKKIVYTTSVLKYSKNGFFIIKTYLDEAEKDNAIKLIDDIITSLKKQEYLEECIAKLIKGMELELLREEDGKYSLLANQIASDLNMRPLSSIIDTYKKMNSEDVCKFIDRINLNKAFFFRGENHE